MVSLVAIHWLEPGDPKGQMEAFLQNSKRQAKGIISRQILRSRNDPNKITTVSTFESFEDYENFFHIDPKRLDRPRTTDDPTELDVYDDITPK